MKSIRNLFVSLVLIFVFPMFMSGVGDDYDYIFNTEVTVADAVSAEPLEGVTVKLLTMDMKKTGLRVKTDEAGKIKLENLVVNYYLSFSKSGYRTKVVKLDENKPAIDVTLNPKK